MRGFTINTAKLMKNRRFVWARTEDTARQIGTALIVAALVGLFFDPLIRYVEVGLVVVSGFVLLFYGWTEERK